MKKIRHYNVLFRAEPHGGFTVIVPSLPGCVTWGKTIAHAREMARDAIDVYIVSLEKHGDQVPTDNDTLISYIDTDYAGTASNYAS